jgi:type II secretory pathway pseudopilin PulG
MKRATPSVVSGQISRSGGARFPHPSGGSWDLVGDTCWFRCPDRPPSWFRWFHYRSIRRGVFTVTELLIALALVGMIAAACAGLFLASERAFMLAKNYATLAEEGQLTIERIRRAVERAHATRSFPGFLVLQSSLGAWQFPDTLVVWWPNEGVSSERELPRMDEIVVFCPDPAEPQRLLELRFPGDSEVGPPAGDSEAWRAAIAERLQTSQAEVVVLTDRLRTVHLESGGTPRQQAGVFFFDLFRPSEEDLARFRMGASAWEALPWVQSAYGTQYGLRQHWLRIELQLVSGEDAAAGEVVPFFGSAAIYYGVRRVE